MYIYNCILLHEIVCYYPGTFSAAQAFELLALVLMILGAILVAVYVFVESSRGKCMAIMACSICLAAGKCQSE